MEFKNYTYSFNGVMVGILVFYRSQVSGSIHTSPSNRPYYINTFQRNLRNVYLFWYVRNPVCLSFVCSASTVNTSLCRGLKYLLKVRYIFLVYHNVARFSFFDNLCLGRSKTFPYV